MSDSKEKEKEVLDTGENDAPDIDALLAEVDTAASEGAAKTKRKPQRHPQVKKSSNKMPIFLLFITLLGAGYIFAPQALKEELLEMATALLHPEQSTVAEKPIVPAVSKQPIAKPKPVIKPAQAPEPVVVSASSDEINRMLSAMSQLQNELKSVQQQQRQLEETQHSVQRMQLRARLRWITNTSNHLPQLQLAWEEISLMPMLSSNEREQAQAMLALSEKSLNDLLRWQQILQSQADALPSKAHDNVVPAFENSWLNWLAGQFSLRPSLSQQEAEDAKLREALLNTSRNLELEQWPDAKAWLQLRATLQLRVVTQGDDSSLQLDLPESFDGLKGDIAKLRETAATWMEQLQ